MSLTAKNDPYPFRIALEAHESLSVIARLVKVLKPLKVQSWLKVNGGLRNNPALVKIA